MKTTTAGPATRQTKAQLITTINDMRTQMAATKAELIQRLDWHRSELEIAYARALYDARQDIHAANKYPPLEAAAGQIDILRLLFEQTAHAHRNAAAALYGILQGPLQGHPNRDALIHAIQDRTHVRAHDHVDAQLAACRDGTCGATEATMYQVHYEDVTRAYERQRHASAA